MKHCFMLPLTAICYLALNCDMAFPQPSLMQEAEARRGTVSRRPASAPRRAPRAKTRVPAAGSKSLHKPSAVLPRSRPQTRFARARPSVAKSSPSKLSSATKNSNRPATKFTPALPAKATASSFSPPPQRSVAAKPTRPDSSKNLTSIQQPKGIGIKSVLAKKASSQAATPASTLIQVRTRSPLPSPRESPKVLPAKRPRMDRPLRPALAPLKFLMGPRTRVPSPRIPSHPQSPAPNHPAHSLLPPGALSRMEWIHVRLA